MEKYLNFAQKAQNDRPEVLLTLVDFSGSMSLEDYKPSRLEGAINANHKLIQTKARQYPDDLCGVIAFHHEAVVLHEPVSLAGAVNSLCKSLRDYDDSGGTDFTWALELAERVFFTSPPYGKQVRQSRISRFLTNFLFEATVDCSASHIKKATTVGNDITRRIIMLTDGEHVGEASPVKIANRLKGAGVIIECIGIAGNRHAVDEKMLKRIASVDENGKPRYCFIGNSESLLKKYESLAHHIRPV